MRTIKATEIVTLYVENVRGTKFVDVLDICDLQKVINYYVDDKVFFHNRDIKGRFCKSYLADCNGNEVCDTPKAKVGTIDFGDYSYISVCIGDLDYEEVVMLKEAGYEVEGYYVELENN